MAEDWRESQGQGERAAGEMEAFTSGGLAAWGVPFLELARRGRTDGG